MKKRLLLYLMVSVAAASLNAQTVKLPTKKTTGTTVKQEKETPKTTEQAPQKKEVTPQKTQVQPQKTQGGTIMLPTKKKVDVEEVQPKVETSETTAMPVTLEPGKNVPMLPVVKKKTAPRAKPIVKKPKVEDNEIYESAEHMPTYPGGVQELMKFIEEKMVYPEQALADSAQGLVQVSFIVEKDGTPTDFEVIDEHHPALEAEAVRILQQMPKWKPATQNGVKVRVEYVLPVKFVLSSADKKSNE